MRWKTRN